MIKLMVFVGTADGVEFIKKCLSDDRFLMDVYTYGGYEKYIKPSASVELHTEAEDPVTLAADMSRLSPFMVIDALPDSEYEISKGILLAANATASAYIKLLDRQKEPSEFSIEVENAEKAVRAVNLSKGNVLLTTGLKDIEKYGEISSLNSRVFIKLPPEKPTLAKAARAGFTRANIIPDSSSLTETGLSEICEKHKIKYIITADNAPDLNVKRAVSSVLNITLLEVSSRSTPVYTLEQAFSAVTEGSLKKNISVVGIGPGAAEYMSLAAANAIKEATLIIGSEENVKGLDIEGKTVRFMDDVNKIAEFLLSESFSDACVVFPGDLCLCSDGGVLTDILTENDITVNVIQGLSEASYLASRININMSGCKAVRAREPLSETISEIRESANIFVYPDVSVNKLMNVLLEEKMNYLRVCVGMNLSYKNEKIVGGNPSDLVNYKFNSPALVYIENDRAGRELLLGISDRELVLSEYVSALPSEVRSVILSKLSLKSGGNCYDIGAGTGALAVEIASLISEGTVYVLEHNTSALNAVYANIHKFPVKNVLVCEGNALESIEPLPPAASVYIGEIKEDLSRLLRAIAKKSEKTRFVAATAIPEELLTVLKAFEENGMENTSITHISLSKGKKAGEKTILTPETPVYIISGDYIN